MKIVLAGSPKISVNAFEQVIKNFDVVAIVTQPDKPKGRRGMQMQPTEVSLLGEKYGIKVLKPNKIKDIEQELKDLNFDLFLSFAFGQWIPESILKIGKHKPLNIHGSLLPKYRGAAPIHYAILNGDKEIGITLMEMVKEMDAGDMYFKASQNISDKTTTGQGFEIIDKLATLNIVDWINKLSTVKSKAQGNDFTLSPKIEKSFGELKEDITVEETIRKVRGLSPFPGAFKNIDKKRIKIFDVSENEVSESIEITCSDGKLYAIDFQWESKKRRTL